MTKLEKINSINTYTDDFKYNYDLIQYISENLLDLGFRPRLKGFIYIKEAIYLYISIQIVNSISREVYAQISDKYNVTVTSVDCSIKKSIEAAWYSNELNTSHKLFRCSYIKTDYPPTNSEFIATMAEVIRLTMKKQQF